MALGIPYKNLLGQVIGDLQVRAALQAEGSVLLVARRGWQQCIPIIQAVGTSLPRYNAPS